MPRKKLLLVYNPFSGKGGIIRSLHEIISVFTADGYDVTVHPTSRRGDGRAFFAENAADFDLVCSCGGDGMLHELFDGIKDCKEVKCGYIPAGTMNDFASSLGIPKVMPDAADMIVRGSFRSIDEGVFNNSRFAYVAAFGAFTEVSYSTSHELKSFFGAFAYFIEGIKRFDLNYFSEKSSLLKITCQNSVYEGDFILGLIGNTLSVAGMTNVFPSGAAMDDGLLDCVFIRMPKSLAELDRIRAAVVDENKPCDSVLRLRTDKLLIESEKPITWDLDGEYGGSTDRAEISVLKRAVTIAVPENQADAAT